MKRKFNVTGLCVPDKHYMVDLSEQLEQIRELVDGTTFIVEGNTVRIVNSAVYAMQVLQSEMAGEAERAGLNTDDDVMALVKKLRNEDEMKRIFNK